MKIRGFQIQMAKWIEVCCCIITKSKWMGTMAEGNFIELEQNLSASRKGKSQGCTGTYEESYDDEQDPKGGQCWNCPDEEECVSLVNSIANPNVTFDVTEKGNKSLELKIQNQVL
ncbi:hypothetical protein DEO72_LG5g1101 [Vigna unguiculata]|uniref:Uncharacterized protein n=1 Tax=Vigna unguiculata TaxID=3917 RepID=A0A4D6LX20_VIGUN|nr:hypothetical protein DEO72_LG5g1101 [Vigna unguiculata]